MLRIESINNSKISELLKLTKKSERYSQKLFLIEGYHLVEEAYNHKRLKMIVTTCEEDFNKYNVDGYLVTEKIINKLSTTVNSQNIIGVCKLEESNLLDSYKKIVLLDNINDPGNLGTIIRTSAALGIDAIVLINDCVDLYNEKTIRATQGSLFKIPVINSNIEKISEFKNKNNIKLYTTSLKSKTSISEIKKTNSYILAFGNEANGISSEVEELSDYTFIIPMKNNVESLNVGIATALSIYEMER